MRPHVELSFMTTLTLGRMARNQWSVLIFSWDRQTFLRDSFPAALICSSLQTRIALVVDTFGLLSLTAIIQGEFVHTCCVSTVQLSLKDQPLFQRPATDLLFLDLGNRTCCPLSHSLNLSLFLPSNIYCHVDVMAASQYKKESTKKNEKAHQLKSIGVGSSKWH